MAQCGRASPRPKSSFEKQKQGARRAITTIENYAFGSFQKNMAEFECAPLVHAKEQRTHLFANQPCSNLENIGLSW